MGDLKKKMIVNQSAKKRTEILQRAEREIALYRQLFPSRTRPARLERGDVFVLFQVRLSNDDDFVSFFIRFHFFPFFFYLSGEK